MARHGRLCLVTVTVIVAAVLGVGIAWPPSRHHDRPLVPLPSHHLGSRVTHVPSGAIHVSNGNSPEINAIAVENKKPGIAQWQVGAADAARNGEIQGYASQPSAAPGETLAFYVSTLVDGVSATAEVYRMGWYGGAGGRLVATMPFIASNQGTWSASTNQGKGLPDPDPSTGLLELHWKPSFSLRVRPDWTTGYYLVKLTESATHKSSYAIFVVRAASPTAPFLVEASYMTWEAYNLWGGASLYGRYRGAKKVSDPAVGVSLDRPFGHNFHKADGDGDFLQWEYSFVRWAERTGINIDYTTDLDISETPSVLASYRGGVTLGHDEYWTSSERDAYVSAISHGVNVAALGADTSEWKVRLGPSSGGAPDRTIVCYKVVSEPNPPSDPALLTGQWRGHSINKPENEFLGVMYAGSGAGDLHVSTVVPDWLFQVTNFKPGDTVAGLVGYEFDRVWTNGGTPPSFETLFESDVDNTSTKQPDHYAGGLYTAASGAMVFAAGTVYWAEALDDFSGRGLVNSGIQQLTQNLLAHFLSSPTN